MEALGLPRAATAVLTTLLAEHSVSSWKLAGEGDTTVFILRLCIKETTGEQPLQPVAWRRKPPCQRRRDVRRAILHQQQRGNGSRQTSQANVNNNQVPGQENGRTARKTTNTEVQASDDLMTVFNEPQIDICQRTQCVSESATHDTRTKTLVARDSARDKCTKLEVGEACSSASYDSMSRSAVCDKPATCCEDSINTDDSGILAEETINIEHLSETAGIKISIVKKCINQLKDSMIKQQLKDQRRNRTLNRVVVDRRFGGEVLVGDSDDFMITIDCQHGGFFQWFLKHKPEQYVRHMLPFIEAWPPADAKQYKDVIDRMSNKLDSLCVIFDSMLN